MQETSRPTPTFQWWHTAAVVLGAFVLTALVGTLLLTLVYGVPEDNAFPTEANFWILLPLQAAAQYLLLRVISNTFGTGSFADDYGFEIAPKHVVWLAAGAISLYVLGILNAGYRAILDIAEDNPQSIIEAVLEVRTTPAVIPMIVSTVVLAPILEEMTFRGLLYRTAVDRGLAPALTTIITASAFMLSHTPDPELLSKAGSATLVTLFLFGVILAEIRRRTGSLAAAIFTHSGFNLTTMIALLFFTETASG